MGSANNGKGGIRTVRGDCPLRALWISKTPWWNIWTSYFSPRGMPTSKQLGISTDAFVEFISAADASMGGYNHALREDILKATGTQMFVQLASTS